MAAQNGLPNGTHTPHDSAHSVSSAGDAVKVQELEDEVQFLAEKLNNASAQVAEHENEKRVLEAKLRQEQRRNASIDSNAESAQPAVVPDRPQLSRFGSILQSRKAVPTVNGSPQTSSDREKELIAELANERIARVAAEKKAKEAHEEIEELTESLFQQANEMVAAERKVNAALEEKLRAMEQQTQTGNGVDMTDALQKENNKLRERIQLLQQRDGDRRRRLEKIEAANKRIDRARSLLIPR